MCVFEREMVFIHTHVYMYIYLSIYLSLSLSILFWSTDRQNRGILEHEKHIHTQDQPATCLKVPCSYYLTAMSKFALLRYLSEFRLGVSSV